MAPSSEPSRNTIELIESFRQNKPGSRSAEELIVRFRPWLAAALRARGVPDQDMNDLIQDMWMHIWMAMTNGGGYDPARKPWRAYLSTICENEIRAYRKKHATMFQACGGTDGHEIIDNLVDECDLAIRELSTAMLVDQHFRMTLFIKRVGDRVKKRMDYPERFDPLCLYLLGELSAQE